MAGSRKGADGQDASHVIQQNENYEMTQEAYDVGKAVAQARTGYPVSDTPDDQKAVDEKLPMGSQSY